MLKSLSIRNYALISSLRVDFDNGLSTITGETGAGKSILMGALSLILGSRADTGSLKNKTQKCIVEGIFETDQDEVKALLLKYDLDLEKSTILRREIVPSGKSRAFINDTPVTLSVLKELGDKLVNIHAQHENLMLNQENFPLLALDAYAKIEEKRRKYTKLYIDYQAREEKYLELKKIHDEEKRNQDFLEFQLNQLLEAKLNDDKQVDLENEREVLEHSEEIQVKLGKVGYVFDEDDRAILPEVKQLLQTIRSVEPYYSALAEPLKRLDVAYLELKDLSAEFGILLNQVDSNPERLQIVQDRLDLFYSLQQKHQLNSQEELIALRDKLDEQIQGIDLSSEHLTELEKELELIYRELLLQGNKLSELRLKGKDEFCRKVQNILVELGMPNARFDISHLSLEKPKSDGLDEMEFLFAANKNQDPVEVTKVASGGEISRLMLSIKGLISKSLSVKTLIFDEIDAGVSGEIADKMGKLIKSISSDRQVLNITHLPQVARSGDHHYVVYKYDDAESSHTAMKKLGHDERIQELAKMLSGEKVTEEALNNARQLLN